jgi:hypothetical protein
LTPERLTAGSWWRAPAIEDQMSSRRARTGQRTFAWLSALGLVCWFVVGFPFGNHNESYHWAAYFQHASLWDALWTRTLAATPRPLGQGLAFVGWYAGGGSSWPVQLFNLVVAAVALWMATRIVSARRTFALTAMVAGAGFFTGYIYLFHLHGIFYSPVLALMTALLYLHQARGLSPLKRDVVAFGCALGVGLLFHPYALLLFLGYLAGASIEQWAGSSAADLRRRTLLVTVSIAIVIAVRPGHHALSSENVRAFVTSYALTAVAPASAFLASLLAVATPLGIAGLSRPLRVALAGVILVCCGVGTLSGLPVLVVWVAIAIFKAAYLRKWALTGVTASAALLPFIAPSGSPTYAIFAIFASALVSASDWTAMERRLQAVWGRWVGAAALCACLLVIAVRMGVEVPIVSHAARPLMSEREKTRQLETIIDWMLTSEYGRWHLVLERNANPVELGRESIDRRSRPPTYQSYLDTYLDSRRDGDAAQSTLVVTFGDRNRAGMMLVKMVPGQFAGAAMVFK